MASAAAVSADIDRPPVENDVDESGGVTSYIAPNNPEEEDDDEDEDIQRKGRRQDRVNQANGDDDDPGTVDDDDLFGDDDDELPENPAAEYVWNYWSCGCRLLTNTPEHQDESLTMRTSTLATMTAEWIALGMMLQRKSRRCKSKRRSSWTSIFLDKPGLNPAMAR